ncbi:MAG TPA: hypothetical protein C5S50_03295 [Methanosarcinaceae archaeon]|nr:hypothetical protein [Methanosarcinaceae archaeon]
MTTTIQISDTLHSEMIKRKLFDRETYEEVIWDLIEDTKELNEQTKTEIAKARAEIKAGQFHTLAQVKEQLVL